MTTKTIKPSGAIPTPDFILLSSWESSLTTPLAAPQQADIYNYGSGGMVEAGGCAFLGLTTTATNKIILNVPVGERHNGVAHSGAYITNTAGASAITTIRMSDNTDFFDVNWLEVESLDTLSAAFHYCLNCNVSNSFNMSHTILHAVSAGPIGAFAGNGTYVFRNVAFYTPSASRTIDIRGTTSSEFSNCTVFTQGGDFPLLVDSSAVIKNTYVGGASSQCFWSGSSPTGNNNASSDTTATAQFPTGSINSISGASAFVSATSGSENFLLKSGSPLINVGATLGAVTDDYIGTSRPQSTAYDIGANEFIFGGPTSVYPSLTTLGVGP